MITPEDIKPIQTEALEKIQGAKTIADIEQLQQVYFSRKGKIPALMQGLKEAAPEHKPLLGKAINSLKKEIQGALDTKQQSLTVDTKTPVTSFDYTLPGAWRSTGTHHIVHNMMDHICDIFSTMGFVVADGPDIETVFNNFDALNTPEDHPSRDPQDTFYLEDGTLLRTQTSPVQIRYMQEHEPPIRIVAPGRCYRRDTPDATHSANFHQIEGLYIARDVSMADLKGDLLYFARKIMGPEAKVRFRPHFFPFTEPSVEVDFYMNVGKHQGWLEIAGAGMVDPHVLQAVGYDPEEYTGYAFGMGIERIAMILYEIEDIRHVYENQRSYLNQF